MSNQSAVVTGLLVGAITAQEALFAMLNNNMEYGTCRHCWKEICKLYTHFRHIHSRSAWCYEKKSTRRWKNTIATPATETDIPKRIIKSYEV